MDDVLFQLWTIRERGPDRLIRVSCHFAGRGSVWKRLLTNPLDAERLVLGLLRGFWSFAIGFLSRFASLVEISTKFLRVLPVVLGCIRRLEPATDIAKHASLDI
jgi:hypothetical protein